MQSDNGNTTKTGTLSLVFGSLVRFFRWPPTEFHVWVSVVKPVPVAEMLHFGRVRVLWRQLSVIVGGL